MCEECALEILVFSTLLNNNSISVTNDVKQDITITSSCKVSILCATFISTLDTKSVLNVCNTEIRREYYRSSESYC